MSAPAATVQRGVRWQERAACRGVPLEVFFPVVCAPMKRREVLRVLAYCAACPVLAECEADAADLDRPHGIWAGRHHREGRSPIDLFAKAGIRRPT